MTEIGIGIGIEHIPPPGSSPWTPVVLSPAIWLEPSGIDAGASGGIIGTWADASGNSKDVSATLVDTTTYPAVATNQLDGYSSIFLDESNDFLSRDADPVLIGGAFDCWIVMKPKLSEQSYCLGNSSGNRYLFNSNADIRVETAATGLKSIAPAGSFVTGTYSVFHITRTAANSMSVTVNGVDKTSLTVQVCAGTWTLARPTYYTSKSSVPQYMTELLVIPGAGDPVLTKAYYQTKYPSCYP